MNVFADSLDANCCFFVGIGPAKLKILLFINVITGKKDLNRTKVTNNAPPDASIT